MSNRYPEQSQRQRERAARYRNYPQPHQSPKQVTHGLRPGPERGLMPKKSAAAT